MLTSATILIAKTHSQPLTKPMGASRYSNALRPTSPAMLLPTPPLLPASCTITILPVLLTASAMAALGNGLMVLTSINCMDGAGFGGLNLAGSDWIREAGGVWRRCIARTTVSVKHCAATYGKCRGGYRMRPRSSLYPRAVNQFLQSEEYSHRQVLVQLWMVRGIFDDVL